MNHCTTVSAIRYDRRRRVAEIFGETRIVVYRRYILLERRNEKEDLWIAEPGQAEFNGKAETCEGILKGAGLIGKPWSEEGEAENGSVWLKKGLVFECKTDKGDDDENAQLTKLDRLTYVLDLANAWELFESYVASARE